MKRLGACAGLLWCLACGGDDTRRPPVPGDRGPAILVEVLNANGRAGDARAGTRLLRRKGIDVVYFGRPMLYDGESVVAGPDSLRPEDLGVTRDELRAALASRPKDPVFDKSLDTYVVWS